MSTSVRVPALLLFLHAFPLQPAPVLGDDGSLALDELTLDEAERLMIEKALERFQGNVSKAAEALGLSRSALYRRLQRHEIQPGSAEG